MGDKEEDWSQADQVIFFLSSWVQVDSCWLLGVGVGDRKKVAVATTNKTQLCIELAGQVREFVQCVLCVRIERKNEQRSLVSEHVKWML